MGQLAEAEIDAWLRQGGLVVTASERTARALASAFHRARQTEGLKAWPAPNIQDWSSFVRAQWTSRISDGRLLLNSTQEQALWAGIAAADGRVATLLEGPRYRLAGLAMEAHELLCSHQPSLLRASARAGWQNDAAAFSRWLTAFDEACRTGNSLSPVRLPIELLKLLQNPSADSSQPERPPLLLAGFDRILPIQRALFDTWGAWHEAARSAPAQQVQFHETLDDQAELDACAIWTSGQLAANPTARILIVTQDVSTRRGQIERAFLGNTGSPFFEFSLGIPLSQIALPRAAHLLLRWLSGPLAEHELDWLFSTSHAAANQQESRALQAHMRALRSRGLEQPDWILQAFIQPIASHSQTDSLPKEWVGRIVHAHRRVSELTRRPQSPLDWAELIPQLLESLHFAAAQTLSSAEFQSLRRWQQVVETTGSLGFDARRVEWKDFLAALARTLDETLFASESRDAPIQIAGPAESAGLTANAVWFLGATEDAWPASGSTHPLLPLDVQRESRMPHATAQLDWDLAQAITTRLLASTSEVHFSYARQTADVEARPSRLIVQLAGSPQTLPTELTPKPHPAPLTVSFEDVSRIPFVPGKVSGGAAVLTAQSQCPFKAFATARLGAQGWQPAQAGLTPSQRGQLLHAVLHAIWAGPPNGIRAHADLLNHPDWQSSSRQSSVQTLVEVVFAKELRPSLRSRMPARYIELEQQRLTRLVTEWLEFESTRVPFEVLETEASRTITLAGLTFDLRLDRLDRLNDGSVLVVDYKSGDVTPKSWDLPRPNDVQLPLYAGFALDEQQELGGLVFAKVRPRDLKFAGCVGAPAQTLFAALKSVTALAKKPLTPQQRHDWREHIERLAKDFLEGRAEVDPREYPKTCDRCGLQTLCRIQENRITVEDEDKLNGEADGEETSDE